MKKISFVVVLFLIHFISYSTHIVGGDITVKYISGNTFEVKLTFYRDCSAGSAGFDNNVSIGVYDKITNVQVTTFSLPKVSQAVKPLGDACFTPNLCVEEGIYKANVTLPNNANGCYLSWQRCCRNGVINNIVNPLNAGMVFYAEIPNPALHNNSPVFGTYPKAYFCHGIVNLENFSATDIDGDQLVYSLITPLNGNATNTNPNPSPSPGPYSDITWQSPYSLNNIIGSNPNMAINTQTGIVNATPTTLGVFVFAVRVEEFRNGVKIGEIRRDVQYQVINCQNTNIPGSSLTLTCANPTAVITCGSSVPNVTYSWTGPGIVSGGNTSSPTVNAPGYYSVVVTQPSGCSNTSHILVNANTTPPNLTTGNSPTLTCTTTTAIITASSTTLGVTYNWSGPGIVSGGTSATPLINAAGTYTVTVTNPTNGCTSSATLIVNNNIAQPNLTTGPQLDLTCTSTSGNIIANSTTPAATFSWNGPGIVSGANSASPLVNAAGTYTVTVTNPTNGCTKTGTVTVINNTTQPNLTPGNGIVLTCVNTLGIITASSTTGGATYSWSGPGIVSGTNTNTPTVNTIGAYTVTVTNPANGCTKTGTIDVTSNLTTPNITPSQSPLILTCTNTNGNLSVSSTTQGVTFNWAGTGIISGGNTATPNVNASGTYTVTATNPANGCTASTLISVTSNTVAPVVSSTSSLTLTCTNTSGTINASSNVNNASYSWSGTGIVSGANTSSPVINSPGTYTVIATNPINGCTSSTTNNVSQNIILPTVTSGPSITLTCTNTSGTISATSTTSGAGFAWAGAGIVSGSGSSSPLVNAPGTYTVTVTNPINGCTKTGTVNVQQNISLPNVSTSASPTLSCAITSTLITANSTTQGVSYSWNGSGIVTGSNTATPTINAPGTYTVTVTNSNNGCTSTAAVNVSQNITQPNLSTGNVLTLNCTSPTGIITANSSTNGISYSWAGAGIINGLNTSSPTVNAPGTYTVTVTNPINGCTNTSTVNVLLNNSIPNVTAGAPLTLTCSSPSNTISASSSTQGVTYNWVGAGIVSGSSSFSPTVNAAGTYTVTVTNPVNGCTNSSTVSVIINQVAPNVVAGNTLILTCTNTSNTINATSSTPNVSYNWSGPGIISGSGTSSPLVGTIGSYTVIVTDLNNGCTSSANVSVNNNLVMPDVTAGTNQILTCTSTTVTASANSTTTGASYSWTGANIISGNNNSSAIVNAPGTYTVTVTDPVNGCTNTATVSVSIDNSLPTVNTGPDLTLTCVNTSGTITANSNNNVNYNWSGPGIVSGNTGTSPMVNAAGTYTVIVTDINSGCQSLATINVVNDIAVPSIVAGNTLTLNCIVLSDTISATTPVQNATYNWTGTGIISGNTTSAPIVNTAGVYIVTVTNPVNGCTNTASVLVIDDKNAPDITAGASITLTCTTTEAIINASSTTINVSYNWLGAGILFNGNSSSPTINAPGTYTVNITNPLNGCTSSATLIVNSNIALPNVTGGNPITLTCSLPSGIISASSTTANVSYAWTGIGVVTNGNTASPTVNASGTYTVTVTDPINGCTNTTTVNVLIDNSIPNVSAVASLVLTCNSTSDTIFASSTTSGVSYNWTGPGAIINGTTSHPIVNTPGTYTVTITNPTTGCTNTTTVNVTTNFISPILTTATPGILNCVVLADTLNASSTITGVSYSWNGPGILSGNNTASPVVNTPGLYIVTITDPSNGCTASDTVIVTNNLVLPNVTAGSSVTLTCTNTNSTISASSTTPGVLYNWTGNNIVSGATTSNPLINGPGVYVVTVTNPVNGCTNTDSITVNTNITLPNVVAGADLTLTCLISSSSVSASSSTPGVIYNWSGPGIIANGSTSSPTVNTAGTYTVTVTNPINGCTATTTVTAVVAPPPLATVSANITITLGTNTTLNASGGVSYLWSPSTGLSCITCANPIAEPVESTTYCVLVTDQYGCVDSACVRVDVYDPCANTSNDLLMPNIFTPNNDGENDLFFIKDWNNECVVEFSIEIYSRWGLKIFESDGVSVHWDGRTLSGQESPDGTYFYIVKMKKLYSEQKIYRGSFNLVR